MLTPEIQKFLNVPESERDYASGADLLARITGNAIRYREMMRKGPETFAGFINKKLSEILDFRLAKLTHREVRMMQTKADRIIEQSASTEKSMLRGKRDDHANLPEDIQSAYAEALDCLHKERELHLEMRQLALRNTTCPDSDVYPFVKEILKTDDRRLHLWQKYDSFRIAAP